MKANRHNKSIYELIFDSFALPLFLVDNDVRIIKYNNAAKKLIGKGQALKNRAGNVLHCLHSFESKEGCGRSSFCDDCIIRFSVNKAFEGFSTIREKYKLELLKDDKIYSFFALVTVSPIELIKDKYALLMIEDIAEILLIPKLLPICLKCKKIKKDFECWESIELYLRDHLDISFSHGYCLDCFEKEKESIQKYLKENKKE